MAQPRVVEIAAFLPDDAAAGAFWTLLVGVLGNNVTEVYPGYPLSLKTDREISPTGATSKVTKFACLLSPDGSFLTNLPGGGGGGGSIPKATAISWDSANQWVDITYPEGFALAGAGYAVLITEAGAVYALGAATDLGTYFRCTGLSDTLNGVVGRLYVQAATGIVLQSDGTTTAEVSPPPGS
jgi:hypothetical protein